MTEQRAALPDSIDLAVLGPRLRADGYQQRQPSGPGAAIDREAAEGGVCLACGHQGLLFRPYYRAYPQSYRAFTICPECGRGEEM